MSCGGSALQMLVVERGALVASMRRTGEAASGTNVRLPGHSLY